MKSIDHITRTTAYSDQKEPKRRKRARKRKQERGERLKGRGRKEMTTTATIITNKAKTITTKFNGNNYRKNRKGMRHEK